VLAVHTAELISLSASQQHRRCCYPRRIRPFSTANTASLDGFHRRQYTHGSDRSCGRTHHHASNGASAYGARGRPSSRLTHLQHVFPSIRIPGSRISESKEIIARDPAFSPFLPLARHPRFSVLRALFSSFSKLCSPHHLRRFPWLAFNSAFHSGNPTDHPYSGQCVLELELEPELFWRRTEHRAWATCVLCKDVPPTFTAIADFPAPYIWLRCTRGLEPSYTVHVHEPFCPSSSGTEPRDATGVLL
jgi:hypothetical protein